MTIFFLLLKKTRKELVEIKNWTGGSSIQKNNIIFFSNFFFWLSDISSQLFCVVFYLAWVFLRFVKDLSYKKKKSWIKKYITDDMIITLFLNVERSDKFF